MDNDCSVKSTESEGLGREAEGKTEETLSNSEQDVLEVESGVESFSGDGELFGQRDWTPSYNDLIELDLTAEQAQETLRYFSLASTRTNQMMKTHNDLDAVLQLLHEKEKDLELAGKIGQSLLERNKQLLGKMHAFEEFISESGDREDQLRHDVAMKSDLLRRFLKEQEVEDLFAESIKIEDDTRSSDDSCRDDSMNTLQYKCQQLEEHNSHLILEALKIKEETAHVELKEQQLVADCVKQLVEAQGQITTLTDEIASKGEDNIRQQEEITQLISTVVDLQRRHSQLMEDNEELQSLLSNSQCSQEQLKTQVEDLHDKYRECLEMLMENKREVKILNKKVDNGVPPATASHLPSVNPRESLAVEIEETLKRDLNSLQEKRQHTARVLNAVRSLNTVKGGKKLKKSTRQSRPGAPAPSSPSPEPSDDEKMGTSPPQSDPVPDRGPLSTSFGRRSFRKPEKLQIVKPIKGSATLHQWKKLANPTMNLADNRPGVHVKGQVKSPQKGPPQRDKPDGSELDSDEDEPLTMRASSVEGGAVNTGGSEKNPTVVPPSNLGLMSLMNKQSTPKGLSQAGVQPGSILASLLNTTSEASPAKDSVGQVLAKVLDRASKDASDKEPARAESLRSLAKYFSEKEREGSPIKIQPTKAPPPVSPTITPSSGGGILSTILASRGLSLGMTSPKPLTTTANTDGLTTTTTSSLMSRGSLVRNASGGNLMSLARSAGSGLGSSDKRRSLDTSSLVGASANLSDLSEEKITRMPRMSRRASSGDLQEFFSTSPTSDPFADGSGSRLSRSSSFGNIKDLPPNEAPSGPIGGSFFGGLRRSPSLGSLTNLVQRANIGVAIPPQRATSLDSDTVFKPSQSPPSPSRFELSGGSSFFGNSSSVSHSALTSADPPPGAPRGGLFTGSRLSGLAGVGNIWSQGPKRETGMSTSSPSVPTAVEKGASSEERLDKINKAFAFEDFGGLGLMSFFGGKTRRPKSSNE